MSALCSLIWQCKLLRYVYSLSSAQVCYYNMLPETGTLRVKLDWDMSSSMNGHERTSFVAGPSGASVREISKQTGADIKSWTEKPDHKSHSSRPTRSFVIEVLLMHSMHSSSVSMSASSAAFTTAICCALGSQLLATLSPSATSPNDFAFQAVGFSIPLQSSPRCALVSHHTTSLS